MSPQISHIKGAFTIVVVSPARAGVFLLKAADFASRLECSFVIDKTYFNPVNPCRFPEADVLDCDVRADGRLRRLSVIVESAAEAAEKGQRR